jgi:hypothetical protein
MRKGGRGERERERERADSWQRLRRGWHQRVHCRDRPSIRLQLRVLDIKEATATDGNSGSEQTEIHTHRERRTLQLDDISLE